LLLISVVAASDVVRGGPVRRAVDFVQNADFRPKDLDPARVRSFQPCLQDQAFLLGELLVDPQIRDHDPGHDQRHRQRTEEEERQVQQSQSRAAQGARTGAAVAALLAIRSELTGQVDLLLSGVVTRLY
jgi:hypothetical protein